MCLCLDIPIFLKKAITIGIVLLLVLADTINQKTIITKERSEKDISIFGKPFPIFFIVIFFSKIEI